MDINNITFTGRLTADAQIKDVANTSLLNFSVANNTGFGERQKTQFFDVALWGKLGVNLKQYLLKGTTVGITGKIEQDTWTKDSVKYNKWVVTAHDVVLMGSSKKKDENENENESEVDAQHKFVF